MAPVNVLAAKTHFSQPLERVAQGEEVVIAKAGKPVARRGGARRARSQAAPDRLRVRPGLCRRRLRCSHAGRVPGRLPLMRFLLDTHAFL